MWTPFLNHGVCPNNQRSDEKLLVLQDDDFISTRKKQREQRL